MIRNTSTFSDSTKRSRLLSLLLLALPSLLLFSAAGLAQSGDVEIQVLDQKDKAIAGVKVTVTHPSNGFSADGMTNKKGKYQVSIQNPNGQYSFTFEKEGLATHTADFPIAPGKATTKVKLVDQATKDRAVAFDSFNEGVGLIEGGNEDGAFAAFTKSIELMPDEPQLAHAHRLVAIIEAGRGNIDEAETALNSWLRLNPEGLKEAAPAAYDVFRAKGDPRLDEVRGMLQELNIASDYAIKVFNEGVAANRADDKTKAMEFFAEAASLNPNLSNAYQSMAALEFNDEKYEAALPHLKKLTELDPQNVQGQKLSFFAYMNTNDLGSAKGAAEAWGKISPDAADEILEQAKIKFEADNTDDAQAMLDMILKMNPDHAGGTLTMGMLHARKGRATDAKKLLGRFLELAPNHPEAEAARQMIAGL